MNASNSTNTRGGSEIVFTQQDVGEFQNFENRTTTMMASVLRSTMGLGMVQKVNRDHVVKEGQLCKRGDTLKMYKKLYNFYLERKDPFVSGPLLKYGRVGFPLSTCLDFSSTSAQILKNPSKDRFFTIVTTTTTLRLRAPTKLERDSWCDALTSSLAPLQIFYESVHIQPIEQPQENANKRLQELIKVIAAQAEGFERIILESREEMEAFQETLPQFLDGGYESMKNRQICKMREFQRVFKSALQQATIQQEESPQIIEESKDDINDEIETIFHDASDQFMIENFQLIDEDPIEREQLPYLKDPKIKHSIWSILKESFGKDLSKVSVPVYFNQPLSVLQMACTPTEHMNTIEMAVKEPNPIKRLAYLACHSAYQHTNIEKFPQKPFNPLLGETYEYIVRGKYQYFAEQISHHPPICAYHIKGDSGYLRYSTNRLNSKFSRGTLVFYNLFKEYIELLPHNEMFELKPPSLGVHNIIFGQINLDPASNAYVKNINNPEQYAEIEFTKRSASKENQFRVHGNVYSGPGQVAYTIEGKWTEQIFLVDCSTGERELVWTKSPYLPNSEYMYGMSHHNIQMNYLPKQLIPHLPPTDTRFRPDQRAIEIGDFKLAAFEKNRLEEKQRAVRKQLESLNIEHKPAYFDIWQNLDDPDKTYYKYNNKYFEQDRITKNWGHLPDLYSDKPTIQ